MLKYIYAVKSTLYSNMRPIHLLVQKFILQSTEFILLLHEIENLVPVVFHMCFVHVLHLLENKDKDLTYFIPLFIEQSH